MVFCFGSTRGVVAEAVERLGVSHPGLAMVHLDRVWPFPVQAVETLARACRRIITVENNHTGQLAQLLTQECLLRVAGTVRRYDGRQFQVHEVEHGIERLVADDAG
jgi:2-oxoglutarate ferredoxin oxidoreductase subunit alpha